MGEVVEEAEDRGIHPLVVLTKIDLLCEELKGDLSKTFRSAKIKDMVEKIAEQDELGIAHNKIWPVRNYNKESETNTVTDNLTLLVLRQILRYSTGFIANNI